MESFNDNMGMRVRPSSRLENFGTGVVLRTAIGQFVQKMNGFTIVLPNTYQMHQL